MTKAEPRLGRNRRWVWVLGSLLLLGSLAVSWHCAAPPKPEIIRTTIKITKGKPGSSSLWNVSSDLPQFASMEIKSGQAIPPELWARMNGIIVSFAEFGCEGDSRTPSTPLYLARDSNKAVLEVTLAGEAGKHPDWTPVACPDLKKECALPAYYFGPVVDAEPCAKDGQDVYWVMELM